MSGMAKANSEEKVEAGLDSEEQVSIEKNRSVFWFDIKKLKNG